MAALDRSSTCRVRASAGPAALASLLRRLGGHVQTRSAQPVASCPAVRQAPFVAVPGLASYRCRSRSSRGCRLGLQLRRIRQPTGSGRSLWTIRELIHIRLARAKEVKKVYLLIFACLAQTQENKKFMDSLCRAVRLYNTAESHKSLDRMLSIVIVPGDIIVIEKGEKLFARPLESLFVPGCD